MPASDASVIFKRLTGRDRSFVADIFRQETVGGALMLAAMVAAMVWANLDHPAYDAVRHLLLGPLDIEHWAEDGLLTIFFFVAGLELKRELTEGSLANPTDALLPIVAAIAGMVLPAMVYLAINVAAPGGEPQGWAIPMATDIAFALAILAVVAPGLPSSLRAFLLTLAIVDDLGAILVIALLFSSDIHAGWLLGGVSVAAAWWLLQRAKFGESWTWGAPWLRSSVIYIPLALACWYCVYRSGVHATIAGVLLGLLTRWSADEEHPPVDAWEHTWRPISAGVAVPVYALFAAGVTLSADTLGGLIREPLAIGIVAGLVLGKTIGVFGGAYLTARLTKAELGAGLRWREVFAVSALAGVGFTVALLMSDLAFADQPELQEQAKVAVLAGSVLAAILAAVLLRRRTSARARLASE